MTPDPTGAPVAPIAVTMGEPAGIGGEITLSAWSGRSPDVPPFFVIDDPDRVRALAAGIGCAAPVAAIGDPAETRAVFERALPVLPLGVPVKATPGKPDPANARAVVGSIDRAIELVTSGEARAMVTNPIHKTTLYDAGFSHPGHTEYLADRAGLTTPPVMMLACAELRVVPVTIHLALRNALESLSTEEIVHCGRITAAALARDFGIAAPRLAVAGLNPHAGEDGHMGREEIDIVAPAVARLQAEGIAAAGPYPADTLFHAAARKTYDAVLCMYHDQALIPLKTIDFDGGVNTTLGLPFVRTSPDHGTAFDIAGTGKANPASFVAALRMAAEMAAHRCAADMDCRVS